MRGSLITFEGIDGAGKSTHLAWALEFLKERGMPVLLTREPGGTEFGENLRDLLLTGAHTLHPETEALLMFAIRCEHVERVIRPALARGEMVLCDRFTDATYAYQGGGHGVSVEKLRILEQWVHPDLQPTLTLYFDLALDLARSRLAKQGSPDRFEREGVDFFSRVRKTYLKRAEEFPHRIRLIDAGRPLNLIQKELEVILLSLC
ncbi:MAG: dTMP kinase [Burkholderiales bacterium]